MVTPLYNKESFILYNLQGRSNIINNKKPSNKIETLTKKEENAFRLLLLNLPKTEIHLHLEGLSSVNTIWTLIKENNLNIDGISSKSDLQKKYQIKSLDEFIFLFLNVIQDSIKKEDDFKYLINDAKTYLKRNNIFYSEIFFAPSKFLLNGFSFESVMQILDSGAARLKKEENIDIRFIIDVSRSFGVKNAMKNLDLTLASGAKSIIGIGLGGIESQGPAKEYKKVFKKAALNGLKVVAHAGEDVGPESIWDAIKYLHIERVGHGISAIYDKKLMSYLADKKIPLEICPTSNLFTRKFVQKIEDHPIREFYDNGLFVTVNTDDPAIFGIDLIDEYMNLIYNKIFTPAEILKLIKNNLFATFLPQTTKESIWKNIENQINESSFTM